MAYAAFRNVTANITSAVNNPRATAVAGLQAVSAKTKQTAEWAVANPVTATMTSAAIGTGAVCVAAPMAVAAPVLGLVGFGANGIVAGSIAAGVQSGIGSVAAPSLFATLQSAGAGGYGVAAVSAAVQGAGAGSLITYLFGKGKKDENADDAKPDTDNKETQVPEKSEEPGSEQTKSEL